MADKIKLLHGAINYPPDGNGNGDVLNPMPMMTQNGTLCRAIGKSPSAANYQVVQVLVKVVQDTTTTPPTDPNAQMSWMMAPPVAPYTPNTLPAPGEGADYNLNNTNTYQALQALTAASAGPNNQIFVAALMTPVNGGMPVLSGIDSKSFKGVAVSNCPQMEVAQHAEAQKGDAQACGTKTCSESATSGPNDPSLAHGHRDCVHHNSTCCHQPQREWFIFNTLAVNNQNGNLLQLHHHAFRARTIAVAAHEVSWKTNPKSALVIRRTSGLVWDDTPGLPFRFPQFPPYSIVIYQPKAGIAHAVMSDCVDHPDIVALDPNCDVLVFVNDRFWGYADNTGSVSLSVAILDAQ